MSLLRDFSLKKNLPVESLGKGEIFSIYYHNIFDYPLTFSELVKWNAKAPPQVECKIEYKDGFYFVKGNEGLIYKRTIRMRSSQNKLKLAKKASKMISLLPSVKMVGLTGSLAMENGGKESDIDLLIITKEGRLWSTRLFTYILLKIMNYGVRKPAGSSQKDKLCLNIWLDESDLMWKKKDRNFFTAHEIMQIVPLADKSGAYGRFLSGNSWVLDFWPNAKEIKKNNSISYTKLRKLNFMENLMYKLQYIYMKPKMTREVVSITRAIFHPNDLSGDITSKIPLTRSP